MNLQFKLAKHSVLPNNQVLEIWKDNEFIATVTVSEKDTVRVISKHSLSTIHRVGVINSVDVKINQRDEKETC